MRKTKSWLEIAKLLGHGKRTRDYCCASSPSLLISNNEDGYRAHCFKCGITQFEPHKNLTLHNQLAYKRAQELTQKSLELPNDLVYGSKMQDSAIIWLTLAGVGLDIATHYGIGYSEYYNRVFLPIKDNNKLVFWQGRALNGENPKYINPTGVQKGHLFFSDPSLTLPYHEPLKRSVILCEDVLSAIRVGRLSQACALLGTDINDTNLFKLLDNYDTFYIWTDNDKAGFKSRKQLHKLLTTYGKVVKDINTDNDPKTYTNKQIKEIIGL